VGRYFAVWVCSFEDLSNFGGDSGQGMTGSAISGILIKDMIVGKKNAWVKAYNPQLRLPISKTTLSSVAEEAEHTLEVFYFH
jgi:hypothetical protein